MVNQKVTFKEIADKIREAQSLKEEASELASERIKDLKCVSDGALVNDSARITPHKLFEKLDQYFNQILPILNSDGVKDVDKEDAKVLGERFRLRGDGVRVGRKLTLKREWSERGETMRNFRLVKAIAELDIAKYIGGKDKNTRETKRELLRKFKKIVNESGVKLDCDDWFDYKDNSEDGYVTVEVVLDHELEVEIPNYYSDELEQHKITSFEVDEDNKVVFRDKDEKGVITLYLNRLESVKETRDLLELEVLEKYDDVILEKQKEITKILRDRDKKRKDLIDKIENEFAYKLTLSAIGGN